MELLAELAKGIISKSPEETEACGTAFASVVSANSAIALSGDLGTGKTTFVRGLARGLGLREAITSPTYNIYTIYNGGTQLLHMDAFRLSGIDDLESLSIDEFLKSPFLIAVEWPLRVKAFFDEYPTYWLTFDILNDKQHSIRLASSPST